MAAGGNPPYITCKDPRLRDLYRQAYVSAAGQYALSAPFTERFFQLAIDGGFVGMINANSFMKREFGKALIEKILPEVDLTRVLDTAGAYIPVVCQNSIDIKPGPIAHRLRPDHTTVACMASIE